MNFNSIKINKINRRAFLGKAPRSRPWYKDCCTGRSLRKYFQENPCRQCGEPDREEKTWYRQCPLGGGLGLAPCSDHECHVFFKAVPTWDKASGFQTLTSKLHWLWSTLGDTYFQEPPALCWHSGSRSQGQLAKEDHRCWWLASQKTVVCGQTEIVKGILGDLDGLEGSAPELKSRMSFTDRPTSLLATQIPNMQNNGLKR